MLNAPTPLGLQWRPRGRRRPFLAAPDWADRGLGARDELELKAHELALGTLGQTACWVPRIVRPTALADQGRRRRAIVPVNSDASENDPGRQLLVVLELVALPVRAQVKNGVLKSTATHDCPIVDLIDRPGVAIRALKWLEL